MRRIETIVENYWVGYYLTFVVCVAVLLVRHNWTLAQWDNVSLLGDVFSTAAGVSVIVVSVVEFGGRMVLLIPKTVKAILARGREEEQGRILANYRRAVEKGIIADDPAIEDFLFNDGNGRVNGSK